MHRFLGLAALLVALPAGAVDIEYVAVRDSGNPAGHRHELPRARLRVGAVRLRHLEVRGHERPVRGVPEREGGLGPARALQPEHGLGRDLRRDHAERLGRQLHLRGEGRLREQAGGLRLVLRRAALRELAAQRPGERRHRDGRLHDHGRRDREQHHHAQRGDATVFLPSENEWYKAAYYSPGGTYFEYPTGTDTETGCVAPASDTGNSANCDTAVNALTDVGAYALSASPYGTFDQGGNVAEWNEQIGFSAEQRGFPGRGLGLRRQQPRRVGRGARPRPDGREQRPRFSCRAGPSPSPPRCSSC